jgi:hypothetical protein
LLATEKVFGFNESLSSWIDRRARSLDLALSGAKYTNQNEDSTAVVSQEVFAVEGNPIKYKLDFDLDLALPNVQKKYKIMFSNYNRNEVRRSGYSRRKFRDDPSSNYGATFSFLQKIGDFDVTFQPRIKIQDPIATYYNLRFESKVNRGKFDFYTRFEFFADSDKGTGQFTSFTFRRAFWDNWANSLVFEEEYQDGRNLFSTLQGYTVHYQINNEMTLNQSFVFSSNNKVHYRLEDVSIGPSFTHMLLPKELEYSVNYTHIYNRNYDFRGRSSGSIIVSMIF